MAQKIAFIAVRILGTLAGLVGFTLLWFAQYSWPDEEDEHALLIKGFTCLGILLALYFFYVTYLVWFRYSPLAVRHVIAILTLYLWSTIPTTDNRTPAAALIALGSIVVMYITYRLASHYLNRLLFPAMES